MTAAAPLKNLRNSRISLRSTTRFPPLKALRDTMVLPSAVRGPVDFSHGFHPWIAVACRLRRSGVHGDFIALFQKFVRLNLVFFRARGRHGTVINLLRAVSDVGLLGIDHGRVIDGAEGFEGHAALAVLSSPLESER
jgi:hypothetical protein